jgi:hypothetical protein
MPSPVYEYSEAAKRYRDTRTGRFLGKARMVALRDEFVDTQREKARDLARQLADKSLTLRQWEEAMRAHVRDTFLAEAMLGRGGRNAMDAASFGAVGNDLATQYGFLRQFTQDVAAGRLSEAQIGARAELYVNAATQSYERGRAGAYGISLPAYPADGSSVCKAQDRCAWRLEEDEAEVRAYWVLRAGENCSTCRERASSWNPLTFEKDTDRMPALPLNGNGKHRHGAACAH